MEAYIQFIKSIEPNQQEMGNIPELLEDVKMTDSSCKHKVGSQFEVKSQLVTEFEVNFEAIASQIRKQYGITEAIHIIPNSRKRSLYTSLLSLIDSKYVTSPTYEEKFRMVLESIKFMIAQMTVNTRIQSQIDRMKFRPNQLIDEIKDDNYQSPRVVYYLSLLFDVNIIVFSANSEVGKPIETEIYFAEETYDNCKPHLIFYRDQTHVYSPIMLAPTQGSQLLNYYDHPIIQKLSTSFNKKAICAKDYIKPIKAVAIKAKPLVIAPNTLPSPAITQVPQSVPTIDVNKLDGVNLNKLSLIQLREIAQSCEIEITQLSEKTGKTINKTKAQLIEDLSS